MTKNPAISPFHPGEQAMQTRAGVREHAERLGRRMIRDHLTHQLREFFAALPFVFVGGIDRHHRPWASVVCGRPGFMTSEHERALELRAKWLPGDPLGDALRPGDAIALLGIEYLTRRRNRISARVSAVDDNRIALEVVQAFGNCPQYIQARSLTLLPSIDAPSSDVARTALAAFDPAALDLIAGADNFTIATYHGAHDGGADVSHRGGAPGFIRVVDRSTFEFPDYPGNNHFNTLGNLACDPRAGITFIDFDNGEVLYLSGRAEVEWTRGPVSGAARRVRFHCETGVRLAGVLPLRFGFVDYAPRLPPLDPQPQT